MKIKIIAATHILIITTMITASIVIVVVKAVTVVVVLYGVVFYGFAAVDDDVEASIADVVFLPQGVFVVVHPHFENASGNADFVAESLHRHLVGFLQLPP